MIYMYRKYLDRIKQLLCLYCMNQCHELKIILQFLPDQILFRGITNGAWAIIQYPGLDHITRRAGAGQTYITTQNISLIKIYYDYNYLKKTCMLVIIQAIYVKSQLHDFCFKTGSDFYCFEICWLVNFVDFTVKNKGKIQKRCIKIR